MSHKIVKEIGTDKVVFAGPEFSFGPDGLTGQGFKAPFCKPDTYVIEDVENIPDDFQGGHYTHDGSFCKTPVGIACDMAKAEAEKKEKKTSFEADREREIKKGLSYAFPDGEIGTIDIKDNRDISIIIGLGVTALALLTVGDTTTKIPYRDAENQNHELTAMETIQMGLAFMQWFSGIYKDSWNKKDQI